MLVPSVALIYKSEQRSFVFSQFFCHLNDVLLAPQYCKCPGCSSAARKQLAAIISNTDLGWFSSLAAPTFTVPNGSSLSCFGLYQCTAPSPTKSLIPSWSISMSVHFRFTCLFAKPYWPRGCWMYVTVWYLLILLILSQTVCKPGLVTQKLTSTVRDLSRVYCCPASLGC